MNTEFVDMKKQYAPFATEPTPTKKIEYQYPETRAIVDLVMKADDLIH